MIKSIILFAFFLLVATTVSFSQDKFDAKIRWGEPIRMKKKEIGPNPIGITNNTFYATKSKKSKTYFKAKKSKTYLQEFDLKTLSLKAENELNLTYNKFKLRIVSNFVFGENIVFITSYIDNKAGKKYYLLHKLKKFGVLSKPIELGQVAWSKRKIVLTASAAKKRSKSGAYSFKFIVSDNSKIMMISYKTAESDDLITVLFDEDMEVVNRGKLRIPFDLYTTLTGKLSNSGQFYSIGYQFVKEETGGIIKSTKITPTTYHLITYDAVEGEVDDEELSLDHDISSVGLKIMDDESLIAYGMYSKESAIGVTGSFFMRINSGEATDFVVSNEFEEDFITQHWTARQKKKADKKKNKKNPKKKKTPSLYSYVIHDLVIKENGDLMLLAEQYYMYVTSHTYTDANGHSHTTYTYHYIYNDIIAVNCSNDGEITWKQKIKKRQHSINDHGYLSSFFTMVQDDNVFLIYNDRESNMDDTEEEIKGKRKVKKNTVAAVITLGPDGEMSRNTLFDFEGELRRTLIPKRCRQMSENEILIYSQGNKRSKILGWVTL